MESAGNGSGADYRGQLPALYPANGSGLCRNLSHGNDTAGPAELRCDGRGGPALGPDVDANPVIIAIVITALYSIVCVVGLVGNVLVMYIIVR